MDNQTGKTYQSREEALAAGVDPRHLVEFVTPSFTTSRAIRRGKSARQQAIESQEKPRRKVSPNVKKAARRVATQSRKRNRGK